MAKLLFELYATTPPRLEELAMKAVRQENRIAVVDSLSRQVQRNDQDGFFKPETFPVALSTVEGAPPEACPCPDCNTTPFFRAKARN